VALIDSYVKSKKYQRAVEAIDETLGQKLDQNTKIRLAFLGGQISALLNSSQKAIDYFEKVISYHPNDYEKYFYAELNITRLRGGDLIGKFQDLLKNPNNEPYKGQIYYTMGETYRDNYDFRQALDSYKKVADPELNANPVTKAKAFLAIADINYNQETYPEAKKYYDQALSSLSPTDGRYKQAKERSEQLKNIVVAQETIFYQDSLLSISDYTDEQRKDLALLIKKQKQSDVQSQASAMSSGKSNTYTGAQSVSKFGSAGSIQSSFFAYDEKSLSQGEKSFKRTWGDRKLADNWRYSSAGGSIHTDDSSTSEERTLSFGITQTEIDEILQDVPNTPEEKQKVNNMIDEAMLKMAFGYRSDLNNLEKSNETLLKLIDRNPLREVHAEALYLLFVNAREAGDNAQASQYKRQFDAQFGDTNFGKKILTSTTAIGQVGVAESALEQVRKDYNNGNYEKVLQMSEKSKSMFGNRTDLLAQFGMLEALATGKTKGRDAYIEKLQYMVANFPKTPEGEESREYLRVLGATANTNITSSSSSSKEEFSNKIDDTPHYILVLVSDNDEINPLKASISDFNKEFYQNASITVSTVQITSENGREPAILVRRFNNKKEAMDYFEVAQKNKPKFAAGHKVSIMPLAITNYRFLITENKLPEYKEFLEENYGIKL
jgi:tetratricopeptide (TPR) repeat protein